MKSSRSFWRSLLFFTLIAALCGAMAVPLLAPVQAAPRMQAATNIVISQIYGGGGNAGAPYPNDYVELYNPSNTTLSVDGWSIQYASATGTGLFSSNVTTLTGSLTSGQYYLVQLDSNGSGTNPMPLPDATGAIDMSASNGKVILASTTIGLACNGGSTPCTAPDLANIVDLVGYGTANFFEGSGAAPAASNTTAVLRNGNGSIDTNNNDLDFTEGTPTPRNTLASTSTATATITDTGTVTSTPTVTFTPTITSTTTITPTTTITRTSTITLTPTRTPTPTTTALTPATNIVISEFRTVGPNGGNDEFIELFNPTSGAIDIGDWTINRSTGCGSTTTTMVAINTGVTLAAGQHYLIGGTSYSGAVTPDQANVSLGIANNGGIALFDDTGAIMPIDQVGLCSTTTYHEGTALTQLTTNTNRSYDRKSSPLGVCVDSDNNAADFFLRSPSDPQSSSSPILTTCGNPTATPTITRTPTRTKTPTRTPTPSRTPTSAPAQLVAINEFMPRPGRDWNNDGLINTGDEFIELINHGTISVNISGWTLDDEANLGSEPYVLPSRVLQPGERVVYYGSVTGLLLSDGGDGVRLLKPNGSLIDALNYSVVSYPDQSFCRLPDNGGLDDWNRNCYPTPGLANSLGGAPGSSTSGVDDSLCPVADTLPLDFYLAECNPFGNNIWSRFYWDNTGWYGEMNLPNYPGKWQVFVD